MPAKNGSSEFDYPEFARYEMEHNPGKDFLRMLKWCASAEEDQFRKVFAAYSRTPIAILIGCASIEGYTNYAGYTLIEDWNDYIKTTKTFGDKLKRIFKSQNKSINLGSGIYHEAVELMSFRGKLAHPRFNHHIENRSGPPPTIFDHAEVDFPAIKVQKIVEDFKKQIHADLEIEDLWHRLGYAEIHRPTNGV